MLDGSEMRPDLIIEFEDGTCLFIDLRTCDPLLSNVIDRCGSEPGHAALDGANAKEKKWKNALATQGDLFLPICHERGGLIGDAALTLLDQAAEKYSPLCRGRAAFKAFWLPRLHVTNARGTADVLNAKLPFCDGQAFSAQATSPFVTYLNPSMGSYLDLPPPTVSVR